jgi:predicted nucleic acid-binding protein
VRYLLDVNALVALGFLEHEFHERVAMWVLDLGKETRYEILTCAITELGFVRVLSQAPQYGLTVAQARTLLLRLKKQRAVPFAFIADDHDISRLPAWAKTGRQTTDGHLAELAKAHGSVLATLDERIPSAFLIPG